MVSRASLKLAKVAGRSQQVPVNTTVTLVVSLRVAISQDMLDTADADSDVSSLGEYNMVIKQS